LLLETCAEVVEMGWESFGQNVHENWRRIFCAVGRGLIRSGAWKSTRQLKPKYRPGMRAGMFSTNPQDSSQQEESKFLF